MWRVPRRSSRARSHAAVDHRSRDRTAAASQRGRHGLGRVQRRDLQLRRAARRARAARASLPYPKRHRGHRPRVRGLGRSMRSSASTASSRSRSGTPGESRSSWRATALGVRPLYLCEHAEPALLRERGEGDLRRGSQHPACPRSGRSRGDVHVLDRGAAAEHLRRGQRARAGSRGDHHGRRQARALLLAAEVSDQRRRGVQRVARRRGGARPRRARGRHSAPHRAR